MLVEEPRRVFLRIFSLYSLSNWWDERENDKGQQGKAEKKIIVSVEIKIK
jgi:hypothetical protein